MDSEPTSACVCSLKCPDTIGCISCQNLARINQEIGQAKDALSSAIERRFTFLSKLNSARDPASRLPTEIVRYIFKESISSSVGGMDRPRENADYDDPHYFPYTHRREPLRFGAVCQQWRSIAWGYADLWTTLNCPLSGRGYAHGPQLVSEWIERTGNSRLSIQLHEPESESNNEDRLHRFLVSRHSHEIAEIIAACSSRCESLSLHTTSTSTIDKILRGANIASALRRLTLGGRFSDDGRTMEDIVLLDPAMRHSPTHLRMLSFIPPTKININWTRITHFYAERMSCQALYVLLPYLPLSLTHFSFGNLDQDQHDPLDYGVWTWAGPIKFDALTDLSIMTTHDRWSVIETTLQGITTPSLQSFSYISSQVGVPLPIDAFLRLIQRSGCKIRNLNIDHPNLADAELARFLRCIPTIRDLKLSLDHRSDTAVLFRRLSQKNLQTDPDPFLPYLEQLDLSAHAPFPWRSFIRIFDDDPTSEPSEQNFALAPQRKGLQITFRVKCPGVPYRITDYIDLITLYKLAVLWRKHRVFSVFLPHGGEHGRIASFLEQSYDAHLAAFGGENADKLGNRDLRQDIVEMASLRF